MKVFISYAQKDHRLVHALAGALHEWGLEPLVAGSRPMPGTRLDDKVHQLIQEAEAVVVLATPIAIRSRWVQQEIGFAKALGKHIVPLKTRGARLAAMLEGFEYYQFKHTELRSDFRRVADLIREWAIQHGIEVAPQTDSFPVDKFFQILHLPHALLCPRCKSVDNHVGVCFLCGEWVCHHCGATVPPEARALPAKGGSERGHPTPRSSGPGGAVR